MSPKPFDRRGMIVAAAVAASSLFTLQVHQAIAAGAQIACPVEETRIASKHLGLGVFEILSHGERDERGERAIQP